jgi:hypothetical protein
MGWPFADPPNVAVITTQRILRGEDPIRYVTHDEDDGGWQFHSGGPFTEEDAAVVSLASVLAMHPSIGELADLPLGWCARRDRDDQAWQRAVQQAS